MKRFKNVVIGLLLLASLGICSYVEHNYTRKYCIVTDVTAQGIEVEDQGGELWFYETKEKFAVGDVVNLKMNDNCTSTYIYDDTIKSVKKSK